LLPRPEVGGSVHVLSSYDEQVRSLTPVVNVLSQTIDVVALWTWVSNAP